MVFSMVLGCFVQLKQENNRTEHFGCCWKGMRLAKIDSATAKNMGDKFTKITILIIF